jgi:hypothetical protein
LVKAKGDFNRRATGGFREEKFIDEQSCGIEKVYRREIDSSCGCSGQPGPSEEDTNAPLVLSQKL